MTINDGAMEFILGKPVWCDERQELLVFADTNEGPVELAVPAEVILDIFGALDEVNDDTAAQFYASFKDRIHAAGHNAWCLTNFSAKAISLTADDLTH